MEYGVTNRVVVLATVMLAGCPEPTLRWPDGARESPDAQESGDASLDASESGDAIAAPDGPDGRDAETTPFDLNLQVRFDPPPLRAAAGVAVLIESGTGVLHEATTDASGIAHVVLDP